MRVAIIPARGGSKRIPRKNIRNFCGKPMICWSIEMAKQSGCFDRVIVSTDDEEIADIAEAGAELARRLGFVPRVALLAYSSFGYPEGERSTFMREAVNILDKRNTSFEYDGEMAADVALNSDAMALYPFCRLTEPANVLVMPAIHSASISTKLLQELGGSNLVGPLLVGLSKPIQIIPTGSKVSEIINLAAIAACDLGR